MARSNLGVGCNLDANADAYTHTHTYTYANAYANAFAFADAYANVDTYAYSDAYANAFANAYAQAYADTYAYSDAFADAYASAYDETYADLRPYLIELNQDAEGFVYAFCKTNEDGTPSNGGSGTICKEGAVHEVEGPLKICTKNALHATIDVNKWDGEALWLVKMYEPVVMEGDKIGSLKREVVRRIW